MVHPGASRTLRRRVVGWLFAWWAALSGAFPSVACAQDDATAAGTGTAEDRAAAAEAYDRGTRALVARDYPTAAQWFETAFRMAPASAALIQAIRSHEHAEDYARAATLALRLAAQFPRDRAAARQSARTLEHAERLVRIEPSCSERCTLELEGVLIELAPFFVDAGPAHTLRATFDGGTVERRVAGLEGQVQTVSFDAPAPRVAETVPVPALSEAAAVVPAAGRGESPAAAASEGISPVFALVACGATAVAGGLLTWSGVDTLSGVPAYRANPTAAGLADGQSRESRTDVLIGVTAGLAATAVVLSIVAEWDGPDAPAQVAIVPVAEGASVLVGARY